MKFIVSKCLSFEEHFLKEGERKRTLVVSSSLVTLTYLLRGEERSTQNFVEVM